ncbi:hypothetical protein Tco_1053385 [Tanacetum coccineum]
MNPESNSEHPVTDILWLVMGEGACFSDIFPFCGMNVLSVDELEPHIAYDFFAPEPLPGYAGNPNNNNGWIEADDYLLGELEAMVDELMVVPAIEEVVEPVAEAEEELAFGCVIVIDMEEDLVALFGYDDFEDDASDSNGFDEEEVWEVNEEWLMAPTTPPPMLAVPPPSVYEVGGPSIATVEGSSYPHSATRLLVSDAEAAAGVSIREIGPRVIAVKGQRDDKIAKLTQQVQALQTDVQQRDT